MTATPLFFGFESLARGVAHSSSEPQLSVEVQRVLQRLEAEGLRPESLLSVDVFCTVGVDIAGLTEELGKLLPADARPVVTVVPVRRLPGNATVRIQGVAVPGMPHASAGDARFPTAATSGYYFAAATPAATTADNVIAQSTAALTWLSERLKEFGSSAHDVLRLNTFYVGHGTRDDWTESARTRAAFFPDPGPCATGIPVEALGGSNEKIVFQVNGVIGARTQQRITGAWPKCHWDWPIRLPYRHGNRCDGVLYVGGQVSLAPDSSVIHPGDLVSQTATAMRNIKSVLTELNGSFDGAIRLTAFYESRSAEDEATIRQGILEALPDKAYELSLVGMHKLAYPDMLIEIESQVVTTE